MTIGFIGLTGNIGCGKSTVARMLATHPNIQVYDADQIWKEVLEDSIWMEVCQKWLTLTIGPEAYKNGKPQYDVIASAIFSDEEKRIAVQTFASMPVLNDIFRRANKMDAETRCDTIALIESAMLFESDMCRFVQAVVVVTCDAEEQMRRVLARPIPGRASLTHEQAQARMNVQWPQEKKVALATHVIDTCCPLPELEGRVKDLYNQLVGGKS